VAAEVVATRHNPALTPANTTVAGGITTFVTANTKEVEERSDCRSLLSNSWGAILRRLESMT
jgi:hypothetical protein